MRVDIHSGPAFALGEITLPAGGAVRVEAGAMAMTRGDIQMTTSTRGGVMKGPRRSLGGESFFVNDFSSGQGGVVGVAAALPGDMTVVPLDGSAALMVQSGSWTACDPGRGSGRGSRGGRSRRGPQAGGGGGGGSSFFSGEGLVLLRCTGAGDLLMSSYGAIRRYDLAPGETMTLDTGHVVAFDESVRYGVRKAGGWKSTILGGEGLVTDFAGPGRVWFQTRNVSDFVQWMISKMPAQHSS